MNAPRLDRLPPWLEVVETFDPKDLDTTSRLTRRMPEDMRVHRYHLINRGLLDTPRFETPITRIATLRLPGGYLCRIDDRFATRIDIVGEEGLDRYCLSVPLSGTMALSRRDVETVASGSRGLALRGWPGTRLRTGDGTARLNLWIEARTLTGTLEEMLDAPLRGTLEFRPDVDWDQGLAAGMRGQIGVLADEMARPDGMAGDPIVAASFADLMVRFALRGLAHSHSDSLLKPRAGTPVPAYVHRAEAFIHASADRPVSIADIARAAGCGTGTLNVAFRRFRDMTPLAALHDARLQAAREALRAADDGEPTRAIIRRFGFTNLSRFIAAHRRRFGETPTETRRKGHCV